MQAAFRNAVFVISTLLIATPSVSSQENSQPVLKNLTSRRNKSHDFLDVITGLQKLGNTPSTDTEILPASQSSNQWHGPKTGASPQDGLAPKYDAEVSVRSIELDNLPLDNASNLPAEFDLNNPRVLSTDSESLLSASPGLDGTVLESPSCSYGCLACPTDIFSNNCYQPLFEPRCGCWNVGGWFQLGYHSDNDGVFNNRSDELNLHQGWLFAEKKAQRCFGCWDWGFRADAIYGIDGRNFQSFGNDAGEFDFQNGLDHGIYAWAFPQLYGELRYDNWRARLGHFIADMSLEKVRAPQNFFYSRSYASANSQPQTLSGVLFDYEMGVNTWSVGWTAGWDTGFDRFNDGSAFFGGIQRRLSRCSTIAYKVSAGNLGRRGDGHTHFITYEENFGDCWKYAVEASFFRGEDTQSDNAGIAQYLLYKWSPNIDVGQRLEWWKSDLNGNGSRSTYAYTFGLNYRAHQNVVVRPEVRYNWGEQFNTATLEQAIFGIDAVIRF